MAEPKGPDRGSVRTAESVEGNEKTDVLSVTMAMADYDRTRPLLDGRVRFEGIDPQIFTEHMGAFCRRPVYEEFDIAEMSLSWFVAARDRGEPVIAYPIFPLRMPVFAYMFCPANAPYTHPKELIGKRVGTPGYRYTVNLWLRGLLNDHYELAPEQVTWVTGEQEGAGYVIPSHIRWELVKERSAEQLLLTGEIDAIFSPNIPESVAMSDGRMRRLFPDAAGEQAAFFKRTGILPITHVMVVSERFAARYPWVGERLIEGFRASQRMLDEYYAEPKHLSFPDAIFAVEAMRRSYGTHLWTHGVAANRKDLELFLRYAHEQRYIATPPAVEDLFAANTLLL